VTFGVQYYLDRPKLRGQILQVVTARLVGDFNKTVYLVYLYLTNQHQNSIYIWDYKLSVDLGEGYTVLDRWYKDLTVIPDPFVANSPVGQISIPKIKENMIIKQDKPVGFGDFLRGFLIFAGDPSQYGRAPKRYRLMITDVFQNEHVWEITPNDFPSALRWMELVDATSDKPVGLPPAN
jgi:hypothetical protein